MKTTTGALLILTIAGIALIPAQAERADAQQEDGLTLPEWMRVDRATRSVSLEITAAESGLNDGWNLNGYAYGNAAIVVPADYEIFLTFRNDDPIRQHIVSVGSPPAMGSRGAGASAPRDGGPGSVSTRIVGSTGPGETDLLAFRAGRPGAYAIKCAAPGHQDAGMWLYLEVSERGAAGLKVGGTRAQGTLSR